MDKAISVENDDQLVDMIDLKVCWLHHRIRHSTNTQEKIEAAITLTEFRRFAIEFITDKPMNFSDTHQMLRNLSHGQEKTTAAP